MLATDEPTVLEEETKLFEAEYKFYGDKSAASKAGSSRSRYQDGAIIDLLVDIWLLSKSEYIVCTFSSQVCRVGYELMQVKKT